jgi:hypothetical protein
MSYILIFYRGTVIHHLGHLDPRSNQPTESYKPERVLPCAWLGTASPQMSHESPPARVPATEM